MFLLGTAMNMQLLPYFASTYKISTMRFLLSFIVVLPFFASAQNSIDLVLGAGLGTAYASNPKLQTTSAAIGANGTIKAMWDTRKWQLGAGIDVGAMSHGRVERQLTFYTEVNNQVVSYSTSGAEDVQFATPYYSPHAIVNYKLNIPDKLYFYGGGVLGYTFTRHRFDTSPSMANAFSRNVRGMMTGANLGLVIHFGGRVSLDLSENWRMSFLNDPNPAEYSALARENNPWATNYKIYLDDASLIKEYNVQVFVTTIALRVRL